MLRLAHPAFELRERLAGALLTGRDAGMPFYGPTQAAFVGAISPADPSGPYGTDITFSASSSGPLTWSVPSGSGLINSSTGVFTPGAGAATIRAALTANPAIYAETAFTLRTTMIDLFQGTNGEPIHARVPAPLGDEPWSTITLGGSATSDIWGNKARITQGIGGGTIVNVVDCGVADGTLKFLDSQASDAEHTLDVFFRYADTNNFWLASLYIGGGSLRIIAKESGEVRLKEQVTGLTLAVDTPYDLVVSFVGADISATLDGTHEVTYGSAASGLSATSHGFGVTNSQPLAIGLYGDCWFTPPA